MDKNKILFIGCGQAGNNALNEILKLDTKYNGLFVNTSMTDIMPLIKNETNPTNQAVLGQNVFVIPNADGSGKNRTKAKQYAKQYVSSILAELEKYPLQENIYVVFSMGGGTGSGLAPTLSSMIRMRFPKKSVHLIAIKPKLKENKRVIENAIECWNDLTKAYVNEKMSFHTISFLDNDKRDNELEVNKEWAKSLNSALSLSAPHVRGTIDTADSTTLMTEAKGYQVIYNLDEQLKDTVKNAITYAMNDSVYFEPISNKCVYLGISTKPETFDHYAISDAFDVRESTFEGYNDKENILVISGATLPKLMAEMLKESLDEKNKQTNSIFDEEEDLSIAIDVDSNQKVKSTIVQPKTEEQNLVKSDEEVKELFNDEFWDDIF